MKQTILALAFLAAGGYLEAKQIAVYGRDEKTAAVLKGCKAPDEKLLEKMAKVAEEEARPITDIRASAEYRRLMVGVMAKRAAALAARRLAGEGPEYGFNCMEEEEA